MPSGPVTLLFTDLVSSTELLARAGDEQAQRIFRAHHRLLRRCVAAHDGEEVKWLGDGLMTVFTSTADAVRCAIAMQQAARRRAAGERLAIRVGLNVGEVQREASDYFGTPVVIARRLCDHAEGGQILCSGLVSGLLAGQQAFTFRDCGRLDLKGLTTPVATSEVVFEHEVPTALLNPTPFVGRAAELARLVARVRETRAGSGGLVMVAGEPGIGKTRLLEEFAESARSEGALVLWGRCYEGEAARPYGPFIEALGDYARTAAPETLRAELGLGAPPLARLVPILRERLPDVPEPVALQPDEERARLLDAVAQWLIAIAARTPVVVVLDDLHWADAASVALLRHVSRFAARHRLLLLGTYRDVEVIRVQPLADALGVLPRETTYEHVALAGLGDIEVTQLLEAVADQRVPAALVTAIMNETSGNPFFIREVLLHLVEERKLLRRDGQWISALPIAALGIPQSVRQVIQRRFSRLSENANRWLRTAAGFMASFRYDLVTTVAGLDEADALDALDEALAAQLLQSGDDDTLDFTHALVRHTLYAELSSPRRAHLHRQIAEAMERAHGGQAGSHDAEIARHYHLSAALPGAARGAPYAVRAADHAERSAAFAESINSLRIALELLPEQSVERPRLLGRIAMAQAWSLTPDEAVDTATRAADLLARSEGNDAAADLLADAADAVWTATFSPHAWLLAQLGLRYVGQRRDLTWARLMMYDIARREADDPEYPGIPTEFPERADVTSLLWTLPSFRHVGQNFFAFRGFRSRDEILNRAGNDVMALVFWAGEYRRALPMLEQEVPAAIARGQIVHAAYCLALACRLRHVFGDLEGARLAYARAVELHERAGDVPWLKLQLATVLSSQFIVSGDAWETLLAGFESTLEEDARENRWARSVVQCGAAYAAAYLGRLDAARAHLEAAMPAIERAPGSSVNYPLMLSLAVLTLDALDIRDHAEIIEHNLRSKWLQPDFRNPATDASQSLAILCGLVGRYEEAIDWFAQGRATLEAQGARVTRARNDWHEARMYLRRGAAGDRERALRLLDAALDEFRAIGMPGWVSQAEALRARCAGLTDPSNEPAVGNDAVSTSPLRSETEGPSSFAACLRPEGDFWTVAYAGTVSRLRDTKGLHYLSHLLRNPGSEFHALDLVRLQTGTSGDEARTERGLPKLDQQAKIAYRRRLDDLRAELVEAEQFNDTGRAERARDEMEAISEQLAAAVGLGGRDRETGSATERARMAVTQRVRAAIKRIAARHSALADHLAGRIETGTFCVYRPDPTRPIEWDLG